MAGAARALLDRLDPVADERARFGLDDETQRRDWSYVPRDRAGLAIGDLGQSSALRAMALLSSGLSASAYAVATAVMALEDVLDRAEGGHRHRHRGDYAVSIFGDPQEPVWAWRFEGHHVSINVTIVDGEVAALPLFLGANPAEVLAPAGAIPVARPLAAEEDLALELFAALTGPERDAALVAPDAPDDILSATAAAVEPGVIDAALGVRLADLSGSATASAKTLARLYVGRLHDDIATRRWRTFEAEWGDMRFAFAGEAAHLRPHYYRLIGPSLLVEYDNTQNGANHVHTVVRDPSGDFGDDLLRAHHAQHHDHHD